MGLILFLLLLAALLLASLLGPLLAVRRGAGRVMVAILSGIVLLPIYHQLLRWDIFGMTLRAALLPAFAALSLLAIVLVTRRGQGRAARWLWLAPAVAAVAGIWILAVPKYPDGGTAVALGWPLEPGRYVVIQGGAPFFNHHADVPGQRFALDITRIDGALGARAAGMLPDAMAAYDIFGTAVVAPCDGTVLLARDGMPDTPVGGSVKDGFAGNMVAIDCDGVTVVLAHLQTGLAVTAGETVQTGQTLGAVGSSGNSTEPHLHIHAVPGAQADADCLLFTCEGVPITLGGLSLARNDRFTVPDA